MVNQWKVSGCEARAGGLRTIPLDPRLSEAHRREVESFRRGAALLAGPPEIVRIPYEDSFLPAYYFRAAADGAPCAWS
jgi:hypothetical protein